jgi:hypothetical protein
MCVILCFIGRVVEALRRGRASRLRADKGVNGFGGFCAAHSRQSWDIQPGQIFSLERYQFEQHGRNRGFEHKKPAERLGFFERPDFSPK